MKRAGWAALVVALCGVAAVLWWRHGVELAQPAETGEPASLPPATVANADVSAARQAPALPSPQDIPPPVKNVDYAAQLRDAPDYLEFARSLLGAARAGDHAAQLYIFRALEYCAIEYRFHVDRGRTRRTLDDALRWAATHWPYDSEAVRLIYARCHTFMESGAKDLGEPGEWLRRASDGGNPLAQAMAAKRQKIGGVSAAGDDAERNEEARRLLSMAIRSGDPEVIWEMATSPLVLTTTDGEPDGAERNWFLAACLRGFDCSPQSDAVKAFCRYDPSCQPYESVADVLRRGTENEFPEIEARARWINEKIDAGDWEALGF